MGKCLEAAKCGRTFALSVVLVLRPGEKLPCLFRRLLPLSSYLGFPPFSSLYNFISHPWMLGSLSPRFLLRVELRYYVNFFFFSEKFLSYSLLLPCTISSKSILDMRERAMKSDSKSEFGGRGVHCS